MAQQNGLEPETWDRIQMQVASQGIGQQTGVQCTDCNREIAADGPAKGYLVGTGANWKLVRVYHPDCSSRIMTPEQVGSHSEQEGIVYGTIRYAPEIARQAADDREVSEQVMRSIFGDDMTVIESPLPRHHLTELELGAVYIPQKGKFEVVQNGGEA